MHQFTKTSTGLGAGRKKVYVVCLGIMGAAIIYWAEERTADTFAFMAVGYTLVTLETFKGVNVVLTGDWVPVLPL